MFEIGPGGGVLTGELVRAGARVTACEVDLAWAFYLRRRLPGVTVVAIDALAVDWRRLPPPARVAGNLPFNVATPLIERILGATGVVERAAFMVQKEVAERLVAGPGDPAYGALSVLTAALARVRYLGTIPPGAFRPPPKVAAALVGCALAPPPFPAAELGDFTRVVHAAFAQRRKTLRNSLASAWGRPLAEAVIADAGVDGRCRAEALALPAFVELLAAWRRAGGGASGNPLELWAREC